MPGSTYCQALKQSIWSFRVVKCEFKRLDYPSTASIQQKHGITFAEDTHGILLNQCQSARQLDIPKAKQVRYIWLMIKREYKFGFRSQDYGSSLSRDNSWVVTYPSKPERPM